MKTREIDVVAAGPLVPPTGVAALQPRVAAGATAASASLTQSALNAVSDSGRIRIGGGMLRA